MKSFIKSLLVLSGLLVTTQASALGVKTTTYLRCYYKTVPASTNTETSVVWGLIPGATSNTAYYKVSGNWHKDGITSFANMFYTSTTQATLKSVCQSTFTKRGIKQPLAKFAAADTSMSLDYTIWTQDVASAPAKINKVVVFGDSVSDNGNLYNATQWQVPNRNNYYLGHFTNGKVWNEYLTDSLSLPNYNWAVGGAAGDDYYVVPGAVSQVASYLDYMKSASNYKPANTLFTMLIGANDLIKYGRSVDSVIAAETTALENLIASGAKNILVLTLPALWRAPEFAMRDDDAAMQSNILAFNARLTTLVASLQTKYGSTLKIRLFDTMPTVDKILAGQSDANITNTTQSCLDLSRVSSLNYYLDQGLRSNCTDAEAFVFWDLLHPSTHSHKIIGSAVTPFVKTNFGL